VERVTVAKKEHMSAELQAVEQHLLGSTDTAASTPLQTLTAALLKQPAMSLFGGAVRDAVLKRVPKDLDLCLVNGRELSHAEQAQSVAAAVLQGLNANAQDVGVWTLQLMPVKHASAAAQASSKRPTLTLLVIEAGEGDEDPKVSIHHQCLLFISYSSH
jgi:hypothetical protein